jgi:hypothetical protein
MAAHAGEKAQKSGDFYCGHCSEKVHAAAGTAGEGPPKPAAGRARTRRTAAIRA